MQRQKQIESTMTLKTKATETNKQKGTKKMAKNDNIVTKNAKAEAATKAKLTIAETLETIKSERKATKMKFAEDVQKLYDKYRADVKALRERKAAAWKTYKDAKAAEKAEKLAMKDKAAAEAVTVKGAKKAVKAAKKAKGTSAKKAAKVETIEAEATAAVPEVTAEQVNEMVDSIG